MASFGPHFGFGIIEMILLFMVALFALSIPVITALWIYKDASRKGDQSAAIWAVGSAIAWPIVLIVYLLVRDQRQDYPR